MADRDAKGRWVKGHNRRAYKPSPGRPKRKAEEQYLEMLRDAVKPEDWKHIIYTALSFAKANDARAREWLSDYLLGKPVQQVALQTVGDLTIQLKWSDAEIEPDSTAAP